MRHGRRDIERLLSKDEQELYAKSKQPELGQVPASGLSDLNQAPARGA